MRVPYTVNPEIRRKIFMLSSRRALDPSQIAKIVQLPTSVVEHELEKRDQALLQKKWTKDQSNEAMRLFLAGVSYTDVGAVLDKTKTQVQAHLRNIRDDWVHEGTKYNHLDNRLRAKLAATRVGRTPQKASGVKKLPNETNFKGFNDIMERVKGKEGILLDEWWQFGVLNSVEDDRLSLTAISKDNNRVTLIKKYTPNWRDVHLKLKGLMGEFVSVRVIQNYLPPIHNGLQDRTRVIYEPRMVDVTASAGIMSLAKSFPSDTRNQSFVGRYKWVRFGEFEAKTTSEHILIGNNAGEVMAFRKGSINHVLEQRLMNTLDTAEGQSILVCVDQKNPKPDGVLNAFVDAHVEEEGIEIYNEDYNTIVETIARTKDEAAEARSTVQKKHEQINKQLAEKEKVLRLQIKELEYGYQRETQEIEAQIREQTEVFRRLEGELERELRDYSEQERFLRDTKEGLQQYKVDVLAAATDKSETGGTFEMKGLKVIKEKPTFRSDLDKAIQSASRSNADNVEEMQEALLALQKELKKSMQLHAVSAADNSENDEFPEPEGAEPDAPEADLSLFDEKKPDNDPFALQVAAALEKVLAPMMGKLSSLESSQQSFIEAAAMTDFEVQELRDFVRAEEDESEETSEKTKAEHKDILDNVREFVGKPNRQMKVYQGHARNTLCLRAGIDLTKEKPDDRIEVQFTKHISKSTFRVHFPKYNHDAMLTIVRDSKDKNDFAVKTCLHLDGERWKAAEEEVTGMGGKRLVGKKPRQWLAYRAQILEKLEAPKAKKKARG